MDALAILDASDEQLQKWLMGHLSADDRELIEQELDERGAGSESNTPIHHRYM